MKRIGGMLIRYMFSGLSLVLYIVASKDMPACVLGIYPIFICVLCVAYLLSLAIFLEIYDIDA